MNDHLLECKTYSWPPNIISPLTCMLYLHMQVTFLKRRYDSNSLMHDEWAWFYIMYNVEVVDYVYEEGWMQQCCRKDVSYKKRVCYQLVSQTPLSRLSPSSLLLLLALFVVLACGFTGMASRVGRGLWCGWCTKRRVSRRVIGTESSTRSAWCWVSWKESVRKRRWRIVRKSHDKLGDAGSGKQVKGKWHGDIHVWRGEGSTCVVIMATFLVSSTYIKALVYMHALLFSSFVKILCDVWSFCILYSPFSVGFTAFCLRVDRLDDLTTNQTIFKFRLCFVLVVPAWLNTHC